MSYSTERIASLTSTANPWIKSVRRAALRGELTPDGLCVVEGFHLLEEALRSDRGVLGVLFTESAREGVERLTDLAGIPMFTLPQTLFRQLSTTETTQGVLALVRPLSWTLPRVVGGEGLRVVLDGIQEPGNAGAIVRSAEAFGAGGVVFLKGTVSPFNGKTLRSSAGSLFRHPFVYGVEDQQLRGELERCGIRLLVAMPEAGVPLHQADLRGNCAIVFGNEGNGVRPELGRNATAIRIPTSGVESLNASVAAGVILYEAWRQRMSG